MYEEWFEKLASSLNIKRVTQTRNFVELELPEDISNNLKTRGVRTKKGCYITDKMIYKIIQNTKYIGKVKHGETVYTNIYPAIIDEQTWQKVQNIRNSYKHAHCRKQDTYNYILSGK